MTTTTEKREQERMAIDALNEYRHHVENGLLLMSVNHGSGLTDYIRVTLAYTTDTGRVATLNLSWAIGHALGYRLPLSMAGGHRLAVSGYGYSKPLDVAINLARFYGLSDYALKFEII
jgi:hypothetical protein